MLRTRDRIVRSNTLFIHSLLTDCGTHLPPQGRATTMENHRRFQRASQ